MRIQGKEGRRVAILGYLPRVRTLLPTHPHCCFCSYNGNRRNWEKVRARKESQVMQIWKKHHLPIHQIGTNKVSYNNQPKWMQIQSTKMGVNLDKSSNKSPNWKRICTHQPEMEAKGINHWVPEVCCVVRGKAFCVGWMLNAMWWRPTVEREWTTTEDACRVPEVCCVVHCDVEMFVLSHWWYSPCRW